MSTDTTATPEATISERRLAANRVNAQFSTGPRTEAGKAKSSLNAVKTGLTGRTILLADEEEAAAYRAHVERLLVYWNPQNVREHALVQSLADTQWRLDSIPGLESALYARARERGTELYTHHDPLTRRLLLDADTEVAEAKALKNLRLHEQRLRRQYQQDEAELDRQRELRFAEEQEKQQEEEKQRKAKEARRRKDQARQPAARKEARVPAAFEEPETGVTPNGFEFSTYLTANPDSSREPSLITDPIA